MSEKKEVRKGWALIFAAFLATVKLILSSFDINIPLTNIDVILNIILGIMNVFAAWRFNFVQETGRSAYRLLSNSNLEHYFKKLKGEKE